MDLKVLYVNVEGCKGMDFAKGLSQPEKGLVTNGLPVCLKAMFFLCIVCINFCFYRHKKLFAIQNLK